MLTTSSNIFRASRELAALIADCANLRHEVTSVRAEQGWCEYDLWQDKQTGGGGCRIVWCAGVAWVSRHSGYAWADITQEVSEMFVEAGGVLVENSYWALQPNVYPERIGQLKAQDNQ